MLQNLIPTTRSLSKSLPSEKEMTRLLAQTMSHSNTHKNSNTINNQSKVNNSISLLHLTSGFGLIATLLLICMFLNPSLADKFLAMSPFSSEEQASQDNKAEAPDLAMLMATPQLISQANASEIETKADLETSTNYKLIGSQRQQQLVTTWLAKRYRVANDAIDMLVSAAYLTAHETKLDPLLILSVIAIESRFNPFSESPVGAQGLMQIMSKIHHDKFSELGGVKAALNPVANIKVGALILKDYVTSAGSVEAGLKRYVGASDNETDGGYGHLVLSEYKRLKDVAAGKTVSIFSTTARPTLISRPQEPLDEKRDNLTQDKEIKPASIDQLAGI
nr:transglycosylase SLT domain-containing protein [uncultured Undibacterium sp.]